MYTNENHVKAIFFKTPSAIPITINPSPGAWITHREGLTELALAYPTIFSAGATAVRDYDDLPLLYRIGTTVDHWGCVHTNAMAGITGMVTGHPVASREAITNLRPPTVLAPMGHGFFFLRLTNLRGYEEMMIDFAEEPDELAYLIDVVHQHNLRELDERMKTYADKLMYFGDDLGTQQALAISPTKWRTYLKPGYAELYQRAREHGFWVYMHSDGHILPIIPDLIEIGVQVINPQGGANDLHELAAVCRGHVCLDYDLDRQMFPFATYAELDEHVQESIEVLATPEGGLFLRAEISSDVPLATIEALAEILERRRYRNRCGSPDNDHNHTNIAM